MSTVAYSIGKASRNEPVQKSTKQNPGPGAYAPTGTRYRNSPHFGIGTAKRSDLAGSNKKFVPGPNSYNLASKVGEGPSYFMGEKTDSGALAGAKNVPGPGAYSPVKQTLGSSYSMATKSKFGMSIAVQPESGEYTKIGQSAAMAPGPGAYHAKAVYKNVNGGQRFGTDSRKGMGVKTGTPGPNHYRGDSKSTVQKAAPAYGFGTSRRPQSVNIKQQRPGPGTYDLKGITGSESQGRTLASKFRQSQKSFNPGPGQYTPMFSQAVKSNPGWKIGSSVRGEEERAERRRNYPPPDSYTPNDPKTKAAAWGFGTSRRADMGKGNKVPGANHYNVSKSSTGPAYGMGLKLDNQSLIGTKVRMTAMNPGSDNYNPDYTKTKKQLPAFSMKGRHKNADPSKVPGPGAYTTQHGSPMKKAAPSYGFGTASQRGKLQTSVAPGPGVYSVPTSIGNLPNYTGARSGMAYV